MAQKKYKSVLGYDSPFEFSCKLEREYHRMEQAKGRDELVDHAMNFALSANHMLDWIYEILQRDYKDPDPKFEIDSWIAVIGFKPQNFSELREWAEQQCPEMEYCRQLANATKHLSCKPKKNKAPTAEFNISPTEKWEDRQKREPFLSVLDCNDAKNWRLVIVDGDKTVDLKEVFWRVHLFWDNIVRQIYTE